MMQQQQQQQVVGIHHPGHEQQHHEPVAILLDQHHHRHHHHHHHQQQQKHHQQQQQLEEVGIPEDDEEDEDDDDDDPTELAAAVPSSAPVEVISPSNAIVQAPDSAVSPGAGGGNLVGRQQQQIRVRGLSTPSSSSPVLAAGLQMPILPVPCCRVDGCGGDLSNAGDYHRRHKVCKMHATSPKVINHGQEQRFCQQCSRFHSLSEFDEGKRSCRKRLAGHNERRRRHQPDSLATTSSESPPLPQVDIAATKRSREWKGRGRGSGGNVSTTASGGRRGRSALGFARGVVAGAGGGGGGGDGGIANQQGALMLRGEDVPSLPNSKRRKTTSSGGDEAPFSSIFSDAFPDRRGESVKGKERALRFQVSGEYKEFEDLDVDVADMSQVKDGLDLGQGVIIPPLPLKRDGKVSLLKGWPQDGGGGGTLTAEEMQIQHLRTPKEEVDKRAWQRDDKETLIHCFWECPKVQPIWRWAGRQLGKLKGSKVKLDMQQAVFGGKLESWASPDNVQVWRLLRGVTLWQIWLARKGKVSSGIQWTSNKVIRAAWVDLMMYAVQDWLDVLKKKEAGKQEDGYELRGKFDSKWLVNQFAGKRAEWSMVWKDPDDVLLD